MMKRLMLLIAVLALVSAACGGGGEDVQSLADACTVGETDGDLSLYNWTEYIPFGAAAEDAEVTDLIAKFEDQYGVQVTQTFYTSNEEMLAKVEAGGSTFDLVVPSDYTVSIMSEEDLLVELNKDALPNLGNLDPVFATPPYDPDGDYSVAYQWGTTGIGYSYDYIDDSEGVSWGVIFDPEQRADYAGKISMLDDARESLGAALKYLGYSLNTTDQAQLDEAAALIRDTKADIAAFDSGSYGDLLTSGEIYVAHGYSGDFFLAYDEASTDDYDAYEDFGYAIPNEGGTVWVDTMAIPTTAEHPCTALTFINFILDAENGGELSNYTFYASPNKASNDGGFVSQDILDDPSIYPPAEMLTNGTLEFIEDLGSFTSNYNDAFAQAKS
jgi:spermidine/putrescine transport system substrate-binding protein